ncbi:MAG: papain-like cysteine protease family protein [Pyrinomonadaceae bacterium]
MTYVVPGMTLIPQSMNMSCWYARLPMLIKWKEEQGKVSFARLISPKFDAQCSAMSDADTGIKNPEIIKTAKRIGRLG